MRTAFNSVPARSLATLVGFALALGTLVLVSPGADAQQQTSEIADKTFARDVQLPLGSNCPSGTTFVGSTVGTIDATWCRPKGYAPVMGEAACDQVPFTSFFFPGGPCWWEGSLQSAAAPCPSPMIRVTADIPRAGRVTGCVFAVLQLRPASYRPATAAACITSDLVQGTAGAESLRVGDRFADGDLLYLIVTGPSCQFDCVSGFDMNCDGKLGDFCSIELDRQSVSGVKSCLAELVDLA